MAITQYKIRTTPDGTSYELPGNPARYTDEELMEAEGLFMQAEEIEARIEAHHRVYKLYETRWLYSFDPDDVQAKIAQGVAMQNLRQVLYSIDSRLAAILRNAGVRETDVQLTIALAELDLTS